MSSTLSTRPVRFIAVGVWNSAFGYASMLAFFHVTDLLHVSYLFATIPAWIVSVLNSWLFQRWLVFGTDNRVSVSLLRFFALQSAFLAANIPTLALLVSGFGVDRRIATLIVLATNAGISYVAHARWTFARA